MRVLYVATDLRDADVLQQEVKKAAPKLVFDVCAGAAEARTKADRSLGYDVMLVDSSVAESEQLLLIQHVRSKQIPLPIALLSNQTTVPSSALVSAADECITRGPRLAERIGAGLRMAIERYRVVATTLRDNDRLKRSEARLRLIIEALPAGVVLVDHAGKILAMNLAGSNLVGTSGPSAVVGRELYSLADAEGAQHLRELVGQALGGERGRVEFTCHGPDGMTRRLAVDALCIQRDETVGHGSVLGVLAPAPVEGPVADAPVEFAFGEDASALAAERAALDDALEAARADVDRLEREANTERGRVQQLLQELERARATSAEHHAQRAALDQQSRTATARVEELEGKQRDEEAAMHAVVSRVGLLTDEAGSLRHERQRLAHESDALKQELLEQRRARLELEERSVAADLERERLTTVLASAQAAAESRITQLEDEIQGFKASIGTMTVRERGLIAELDATRFEASRLRDDLDREAEGRARFEADLERVRLELQATISTRDADHAALASRVTDVQASLDQALAREQALRADFDSIAAQRVEVDARLADATERLSSLDVTLSGASQREQSLSAEIATLGGLRAELETRVAALGQRAGELESLLASKSLDLDGLVNELGAAQVELGQTRDLLVRESETRAQLESELRARMEMGQRENELQGLLSGKALELDTLTGQLAAIHVEAAQTRDRHASELEARSRVESDLQAQLANLQSQLFTLGQRASELDGLLAARSSELEGLSGELAASRFEAGQVRDDLAGERETRARVEADLEARTFDLTTLRSSSDADRDVFQGRVAELEQDLAALRDRERGLETRVARIAELEASIAEMEARRQAAVGRVAELEERRRDEQSALIAAAQREAELAQELLTARDEHTRLAADRDNVAGEVTRERDARRTVEHDLGVATTELENARGALATAVAARDAELERLRSEAQASAAALRVAQDASTRAQAEVREAAARLEAEQARLRTALEQAADRESVLAAEVFDLQQERDTRGRQAFELETVLAREREERIDVQARLQVLERDNADAGARAEARVAELARDHQEVVARLQKLLEQAAAREFQAAALARPSPSDRLRRRPAEKIGQLAAAMANDLNSTIADVAEDTRRLLAELPDGTTSRARAEQTLETVNRAGQLVRHLLRLSERESRLIPRVELSAVVRTNEALLRQLAGADVELRFELAAGLPHVECDAEEVVQVLSTLIVTVRGALPLGGVIRVGTHDRGRNEGRRRNEQILVLVVSAEGYGMVPVATVQCDEVVTRCGGTFSSFVDPNTATTSLQASLPAEGRSAEASPGWSQSA